MVSLAWKIFLIIVGAYLVLLFAMSVAGLLDAKAMSIAGVGKNHCLREVQRTTSSRKIIGCKIIARSGTKLLLACPCR